MHELPFLELFGFVRMTAETDIVTICQKKFRERALMHGMAGAAASDGNRTVNKFPPCQGFFMAEKTEVASFSAQLEFVGRLMRVMAFCAFSFFYRCMDDFHLIELLVAFFAELSDIADRDKLVFIYQLMAGGTIRHCNWPMDIFVLPHAGMAFFRYA
jgi:hypothetical protein